MFSIFISILNMSISGSIVIIIALILRAFFTYGFKKIFIIIWSIVFLRLICPFGINFQSIINFLQGNKINNFISLTEYIPQSISILNTDYTRLSFLTLILKFAFTIWLLGFIGIVLYKLASYFIVRNLTYHKNYFFKLIAYFILAIHWFNPLVWIAFKYIKLDMGYNELTLPKPIPNFTTIRGRNKAIANIAVYVTTAVLIIFMLSNSLITSLFNFTRETLYICELKRLVDTDLSNIAIDKIQIGSYINDIDLSIYPSDNPKNTWGEYNYFFNTIRIGVDEHNKVCSITAQHETVSFFINNIKISSIDQVTNLLGSSYLDKSQDREQKLRKHVYYDSKTNTIAEFIYPVYDDYDKFIIWITLKKL